MENIDRLCDWFELHQSFWAVCGIIKKKIKKNNDLFKLEKIGKQIIHIINTNSDRYLASQGVHDHVSTSVKTSTIIQKCQSIREGEEYLNSIGKKLTKMDDREKLMISLGFPTPCSSNSSMTFIGREAYQKELEAKMMSEVVKFP